MFRQWRIRVGAALGSVVIVAGALTGCSSLSGEAQTAVGEGPPATEPPKPGGRFVFGLEADPNGLDPTRNAWDPSGLQLANALYDPIAAIDDKGVAQPYLVESFTPSPDYMKWTFKLRPGVRFSNGEPLDGAAFATFVEALRVSAITGPPCQMIAGTRVVDPLTVELSMTRPWATLPVHLAGQGGYVVSPQQLKNPNGHSEPIGTGPFLLREWKINESFELVKNQNYWRSGLPYLDAVNFVIVPDGRERIEMLTRGDMDASSFTNLWELAILDEAARGNGAPSSLKVERDDGDAEKQVVMFNAMKPPLDDVRVRRAVAYATDLPTIAARSGWPLQSLAQGPVSVDSPFFSAAPYPTYDVQKAKNLVNEYLSDRRLRTRPREVAFTLKAPQAAAEFVNLLVSQWAQAGLKVNVDYIDFKQTVRFAVTGDYEAMLFRYFASADFDLLWHFFVDDTYAPGISINFARLRSTEITSGMTEGRSTLDVNTRRRAYDKVQQAFADEMPYLWLQRSEWRMASNPRVRAAHNVTLPDGSPARPLNAGTLRLTETWIAR
jgi:peptide/nickel transport system substrate-binding protein